MLPHSIRNRRCWRHYCRASAGRRADSRCDLGLVRVACRGWQFCRLPLAVTMRARNFRYDRIARCSAVLCAMAVLLSISVFTGSYSNRPRRFTARIGSIAPDCRFGVRKHVDWQQTRVRSLGKCEDAQKACRYLPACYRKARDPSESLERGVGAPRFARRTEDLLQDSRSDNPGRWNSDVSVAIALGRSLTAEPIGGGPCGLRQSALMLMLAGCPYRRSRIRSPG